MTTSVLRRPSAAVPIGLLTLLAGMAAVAAPTMAFVARESWSTEEGGHGPLVLVTGIWLIHRLWPEARALVRPPSWRVVAALAGVLLPLYMLARVTQIVEVEGYVMYALLLTAAYSVVGLDAMRRLWFPFLYLVFMFPLPESLVWAATGPLKIWISQAAIGVLHAVGYPIGGAGVTIQVGQFQLLVAAACSGMNSIVALTAISLLYVYLRHEANWRYAILLVLMILPIAIFANFVRVIILILLTYHGGEAVAQGFLHNFAGLTMFAVALAAIFGLDSVLEPVWRRFMARRAAA